MELDDARRGASGAPALAHRQLRIDEQRVLARKKMGFAAHEHRAVAAVDLDQDERLAMRLFRSRRGGVGEHQPAEAGFEQAQGP